MKTAPEPGTIAVGTTGGCTTCRRSPAGHLGYAEVLWLALDGDLPTDSRPDICGICGLSALPRRPASR